MKRLFASHVLAAIAVAQWLAAPAHAYNWGTHSRLVETAISAMDRVAATPPPAPAGADAALWAQYIAEVSSARARLSVLQSGLATDVGGDSITGPGTLRADDTECGGVRLRHLEHPEQCHYNPVDNLTFLPSIRIQDLFYTPNRLGAPCGLTPALVSEQSKVLGSVLGWHAATVDDHLEDVILWNRPTSFLFLGLVSEFSSRAFDFALGGLILPFLCIAAWFSGDSCDPEDAVDLASQVDPITQIEGLIPGICPRTSSDYTGLWHFVDVVAPSGRHNDVRGMWYEQAGPAGSPGAVDLAIMAGSDLSGLSLDAGDSHGVSRYGQFDRRHRTEAAWQHPTLGHVEFSPLQNLAQFGWSHFVASPTSALGLEWPLHALGDAVEPHHVVATTSFGHRALEDFVDDRNDELFRALDMDAVVRAGFPVWLGLHGRASAAEVPVRQLIIDVARATRARVLAGGEWAWDDRASTLYVTGGSFIDDDNNFKLKAKARYQDDVPQILPLLGDGVSAILAFLTVTSRFAVDPGVDPRTRCVDGKWDGASCVPNPIISVPPIVGDAGVCPAAPICGDDHDIPR
jgi:hypothetical protein